MAISFLEQSNVNVKKGNSFVKVNPFPVGYIYMSSKNTSPASIYGGTWSSIADQRFWLPGNSYATGGSEYISVNQMPSHNHWTHMEGAYAYANPGRGGEFWGGAGEPSSALYTGRTGGGAAYWPKYRFCYCWVRTA